MNILLLIPERMDWAEDIEQINGFTSMWAYHLQAELSKIATCETIRVPDPSLPKQSIDRAVEKLLSIDTKKYHGIIALGLRFFSHIPKELTALFTKSTNAVVAQLYDGSRLDNDAVDVTFTFRDDAWRYPLGSVNDRCRRHHNNNIYVGWAADKDLLSPEQDNDELTILVDHTAFDHYTSDRSLDVLFNIKALIKSDVWRQKYKNVSVRRIVSGKIEKVNLDNFSVTIYDRNHINYLEICKEYRKAHIFCVTHTESVGQAVIECAMAGALILTPKGFIAQDRLATVRHIEWERTIDWPIVLDSIDTVESRQRALKNSWKNIADTITNSIRMINKQKRSKSKE